MNEKIDDIIKYGVYQKQELVGKYTNTGNYMSYPGGWVSNSQLSFSASQLGGGWPDWSHEASGTVSAAGYAYQYRPDILPGFLEGAFYCGACRFAGGGALPGYYGRNYSYMRVFTSQATNNDGLEISMDWWSGTLGVSFKGVAVTPMQSLPTFSYPWTVRYRIVGRALYLMTQSGNTTDQMAPAEGWRLVSNNLDFPSLTGRYFNTYFYGYRITNQAQFLYMYIYNHVITTYR